MSDEDPPPPPPPADADGGETGGAVPAKRLCERCKKNKAVAKIALPGEPPENKIKACQTCIDELAQGVLQRQEADARLEGARFASRTSSWPRIPTHTKCQKKKKKNFFFFLLCYSGETAGAGGAGTSGTSASGACAVAAAQAAPTDAPQRELREKQEAEQRRLVAQQRIQVRTRFLRVAFYYFFDFFILILPDSFGRSKRGSPRSASRQSRR